MLKYPYNFIFYIFILIQGIHSFFCDDYHDDYVSRDVCRIS